jgi:hypothetical protein
MKNSDRNLPYVLKQAIPVDYERCRCKRGVDQYGWGAADTAAATTFEETKPPRTAAAIA